MDNAPPTCEIGQQQLNQTKLPVPLHHISQLKKHNTADTMQVTGVIGIPSFMTIEPKGILCTAHCNTHTHSPFHHDQQATLSIESVLVHIMDLYNVCVITGPPVEVNLATSLGTIFENLQRGHQHKQSNGRSYKIKIS